MTENSKTDNTIKELPAEQETPAEPETAAEQEIPAEKTAGGKAVRRHRRFVRTRTVFQMEISECGAASLSMIMGCYGVHVPLEVLRVETGVSRNGVSAKNICAAAEKNGFAAEGFRRDIGRLLEATQMPCIIHWEYKHFVVLEGVKHGRFYINDPAMGRRQIDRKEMERCYTGIVLEILPTDRIVPSRRRRTLPAFAAARLSGQKKYLAASLLLGMCMILPGVLTPVFSKVFLDDILVSGENSWMKWLLLIMICTAFYKAYFGFLKTRFGEHFRQKMTLESSDNMLKHLFRMPLEFFEQRTAGDLAQRVQNDAEVSRFLSGDIVTVLVSMLTSIIYLGIMMAYSVRLALIGLAFSALSMTAVSISIKRTEQHNQLFGIDRGRLIGSAYSGIIVSDSLKAAGGESEYASKVLGHSALVQNSDQKLGQVQQRLDVIPEAITAFNNIAVLVAGSNLVLRGSFTPGMLMAFNGFLAAFSDPFKEIIGFARKIQQMKNDLGRVDDLLRYEEDPAFAKEEARSGDETGTVAELQGEVELRNITFAYGKMDKPLIRDFSLKLEKGRSVALVGSSGCGKSTIAKLITSLYEPWSGEILFDGIPSGSISRELLSRRIAFVTQNIILFEGTIYQNITAWNDGISQAAVIRAARDACIHDEIITKPGAYNYMLRDGGSNLSGGQRQRVEIAKALAMEPAVLVFDEATSSLDTVTEQKIYENIRKRGCTSVIVAQRLSSIRDCDEIILLKNGRVIERGSHRELMEQKGDYYELVTGEDN